MRILVASLLLLGGCTAGSNYRHLTIPRIGELSNATVTYAGNNGVQDQVTKLEEACTRTQLKMEKQRADAQDSEDKAKTIAGVITGGIGTIGAGATGVSSASNGTQGTTTTLGLVTAGATLVGTVVVTVVSPGSKDVAQTDQVLQQIKQGVDNLNQFLAAHPDVGQWAPQDSMKFAELAGVLQGTCQ